jgi:hypothetical protein
MQPPPHTSRVNLCEVRGTTTRAWDRCGLPPDRRGEWVRERDHRGRPKFPSHPLQQQLLRSRLAPSPTSTTPRPPSCVVD